MTEWADKQVLVLGLGETGLSLARWLSAQGARVRVADSREQPPAFAALRAQLPQAVIHCGAFRDELLDGADLIAISPGVPLSEPLVVQAVARGIPVAGDIELFARDIKHSPLSPTLSDGAAGETTSHPTKQPEDGCQVVGYSHLTGLSNNDSQVIGYREGRGGEREGGQAGILSQDKNSQKRPLILAVTGANGKTTVTSMVGAMCRRAGLDTAVAGNISPAVLDVVLERGGRQPDAWVLELSSFQLESTASLNAAAAAVLNVSEDHLDRYPDMNVYAAAKSRIFRGSGVQVLNRDNARSLGMALPGRTQVTFGLSEPSAENDWGIARDSGGIWLVQGNRRVLNAKELRVTGLHNAANALAALALCRAMDLPLSPLLGALRDFEGLPHRMERVAEMGGVAFYDDSKGTNVGATVAALEGLGRPAVLIAGGEGKGQDFSPLKPAVARHARAAVLIGRDADRIAAALEGCGVPVARARDMGDAVRQSVALAKPGDAVLLSPACASFDMFRNYAHRAEVFVAAVHDLRKEAA